MKTSELGAKTKELEMFKSYNNLINDYVEKLNNIQNMIRNGVADGRAILGKISLQSYQTEQYGSTLGKKANFLNNSLEMEIKTTVSLELLRVLEKDLISRIKDISLDFGFEEDRFVPIFDKFIQIDEYKYGGWFD